jgi:hypothetical protein
MVYEGGVNPGRHSRREEHANASRQSTAFLGYRVARPTLLNPVEGSRAVRCGGSSSRPAESCDRRDGTPVGAPIRESRHLLVTRDAPSLIFEPLVSKKTF